MKSKYNAYRQTYDGMRFDSRRELDRYRQLCILQRAGQINDLRRQVKYELIPAQKTQGGTLRSVSYIADFVYYRDGRLVVEDSKGVRTDVYTIKKKLMLYRYGIEILET